MIKLAHIAAMVGLSTIAALPTWAQVDRYDAPYDRPTDRPYYRPYDRPPDDRPDYRPYDRPPTDAYQGMRTGPVERHQGAVTFITGGVGRDEAEAFRAAMPRYMLGLEFARANVPRGDFLANVDVSITDMRGQPVLQTVSQGPFLLADLPAGQYTIRASSEGRMQTRTVSVSPGRNQYLAFTW
ncbi:MAG TPA: carboxypeptidase-like regulatory domain-containing protein [Vineibacter sp.]|nr:carboxypeptidase-like regulatory domain-containing protein [Vineibacter sp.]